MNPTTLLDKLRPNPVLDAVEARLVSNPPPGISPAYVERFIRRQRPALLLMIAQFLGQLVPRVPHTLPMPTQWSGVTVDRGILFTALSADPDQDLDDPDADLEQGDAPMLSLLPSEQGWLIALRTYLTRYGVDASWVEWKKEQLGVAVLRVETTEMADRALRLVQAKRLGENRKHWVGGFWDVEFIPGELDIPIETAGTFAFVLMQGLKEIGTESALRVRVLRARLIEAQKRGEALPEGILGDVEAQRVLWVARSGLVFRVAEDESAADIADRLIPLPPGRVRVAKPETFSETERQRWAEILGDYVIPLLLPQLGEE